MDISLDDAKHLNSWYQNNKRPLPWRDTGNPYAVWISEIMLQQTRIEAVIPKYLVFMHELPDIPSLAACPEDHLMRLWEGLGYYSRARNLQKCARVLMTDCNGQLPADYAALLKLPGIGPYTAGAIASIAWGLPVPAIDGNVLRVIARVTDIRTDVRSSETKDAVARTIKDIYTSGQRPSFYQNFNQALMELGETVCLPNAQPLCDQCPWKSICICHKEGTWTSISFRSPLKQRKVIERTIFIIRQGDLFLLHKRPERGLLASLYEFPGVDQYMNKEEAIAYLETTGLKPVKVKSLPDAKHTFTHLEWHMKAWEITVESMDALKDDSFQTVDKIQLNKMAIPSAFRKYIQLYKLRSL